MINNEPQLISSTLAFSLRSNSVPGTETCPKKSEQARGNALYIWALIALLVSGAWIKAEGQIYGPTDVAFGEVADYTYFIDAYLSNPNWTISGGNILSQSHVGFDHYVQVQWTQVGTGTLYFMDGGSQHDMLQVTVNCPTVATPSTTFNFSYNCGNTIVTRTSNPPGNLTWYWQTTAGGTDTSNSSNNYTFFSVGTYYVRARYNGTDCWSSGSASVSVSINSNPAVYSLTGGGSYCSGSTGPTITLSGSQSGVNYQLKVDGSNDGGAVAGTGGGLTWTNRTTGGAYTVVATNATTSCASTMSGSPTVTVNSLPVVYTVGGGGSYCVNVGAPITLSQSQTGVNYELLLNGNGTGEFRSGTGALLTWPGLTTSGNYTVRGMITGTGCYQLMSGTAAVTINPMPSLFTVGGGGTYCSASSGPSVTLSGSQSGVSYQLRRNSAVVPGTEIQGTGGVLTWTNQTTAGTYQVESWYAATNCAIMQSSSVNINVNPSPSVYSMQGGGAYCSGGSGVSVSLSGSQTGVNYQLRRDGVNTGSAVAGTNGVLTWNNQTTGGTYTVVATHTSGGCTATMSGSSGVTVNPLPTLYTVSGGGAFCASGGSFTVTLSGSQTGINYQLKIGAANQGSAVAGTGSALTWTGLTTAGTYTVVATVAATSCTQTMSGSAVATSNPATVGGTVALATTYVYGTSASGNLTLSGHTGTIQRWEYSTGGAWTTIANTTTTQAYNISASRTYRAVVKSGVCAEANSASAAINIYPVAVIIPAGTHAVAFGNNVTLSTTASYYSYQWLLNGAAIAGATAATYATSVPGSYTVQVRGAAAAPVHTSATAVTITNVLASQPRVNMVSQTAYLVAGVTATTPLQPNQFAHAVSYQDGLGRTFQTVAVGQSPNGADMVSPVGFTRFGLVDSTFLPYVTASADGRYRPGAIRGTSAATSYASSEQYFFYYGTAKVVTDTRPFARTVYRNDPGLRANEQGAPGLDWQPGSNHTVRSVIDINHAGVTPTVRLWKTNGTTTGNYANNSIAISIVTDENGNKVQTYTDGMGRTVLKRVQIDETLEGVSTPWLETYYIYDQYNRLSYILPPKAMKVLGTGSSLDANNASVAELIHKFAYDKRGRTVAKKVPGAAVQYIVYDTLDRVVLTQDGNLRNQNKWNFYKYDQYNRIIYTGIYTNSTQITPTAVKNLMNGIDYSVAANRYEVEQVNATYQGYSNTTFPTTGLTVLSATYYDHYDFDRNSTADFTYDNAHYSGQEATRSTATRGLPTGSKRVVLDAAGNPTSYWITSAVFYDTFDRPIQTQTNNHLHTGFTAATLDKSTVIYDFAKALKTKTSHYQNATTAVHLEDWNDFDHAGRVLKTYRKINGGATQQIAQYEYNALGQVVDKKLHNTGGSTFLQSIDFRYNIRGWLASINNAQLDVNAANNDETGDYFGLELIYNAAESGLSNTQYYNGNISAIKWKGQGTTGLTDQRSYKYTYDKSDRLKSATFQAHNGVSWTKEAGTLNEAMTYDVNGNIKTLTRSRNLRGNSGITITSAPETTDNLTYTYATDLDKLTKVEDAASVSAGFLNGVNTTTEYTYATDGSLTADNNKGISSIVYNLLGKPQVVNFTSGKKIEYVYDAAGSKLTMRTYQGATLLTTTNYSGSFVYEGASPVLSFFGSPEGRIVKNGSTFEYQYAIADHQGNTRVVFSSVTPTPEAKTANMEAATNTDFFNYTNRVAFNLFDHTDAGTTFTYAQKLTGGSNAQVGVAKSYKVYAGDKVKIEAWAKYQNPTSTSSNLSGFATALLAAFGVPAPGGGETGTASAALNNWGGLVVGGNGGSSSGPKAFVNIIVFDKNYKLLDASWEAVDPAANQVGASPVVAHDYLMKEYTVREEGYVFMYVSNENATLVDVYFDDVVMTLTKGNVIQYNEYYPFGLQTANSWTRENTTGNNFLGNGGTELNQTSQLYDLDYRNYDPVLGRMNGVDPMATKYASVSPYNFAFNDPVTLNDPSGADPYTINYSAVVNSYYTGYTYDDKVDYHGTAVWYDAMGWRNEVPGGNAFYGAATGYGPSVGSMVSSWAPNFGGPMRFVDNNGTERFANPSDIEYANRRVGVSSGLSVGSMLWNPWAGREVGHLTYSGAWVNYSKDLADKIAGSGYSVKTRYAQGSNPPKIWFKTIHGRDFDVVWKFQRTQTEFGHIDKVSTVIIRYEDSNNSGGWDKNDDWEIVKYGFQVKSILKDYSGAQPKPKVVLDTIGEPLKGAYWDEVRKAVNGHLNCDCYIELVPRPRLEVGPPHDTPRKSYRTDPRGHEYN